MGSFNSNCCITGMPIQEGEHAALFFIEKNKDMYVPVWRIITPMIDGMYNDYGRWIFDEECQAFQSFKKYVAERYTPTKAPDWVSDYDIRYYGHTVEALFADTDLLQDCIREGTISLDGKEIWIYAVKRSAYDVIVAHEHGDMFALRRENEIREVVADLIENGSDDSIEDIIVSLEGLSAEERAAKLTKAIAALRRQGLSNLFGYDSPINLNAIEHKAWLQDEVLIDISRMFRVLRMFNKAVEPVCHGGQDNSSCIERLTIMTRMLEACVNNHDKDSEWYQKATVKIDVEANVHQIDWDEKDHYEMPVQDGHLLTRECKGRYNIYTAPWWPEKIKVHEFF